MVDGPSAPTGDRLGKYRLDERIGVGGMAEVFRALEDRAVGEPRVVVIKRMLPHIAAEEGTRAMFEQEARLGALIDSHNVVRVLGEGEHADHPYLVLEYVPGTDLWHFARWLAESGQVLGVEPALHIVRELLDGLRSIHEARDPAGHAAGIVHCDVSPSNVLLSVHGEVKVSDLGIARAMLRDQFSRTPTTHRARGKLGYVAPETITGGSVDHRADVFSAAVIAAELLMGRPLFTAGSELGLLLAIRDGQVGPFVDAAPRLPAGLGEVILTALRVDPEERYIGAAEFREALAPFCGVTPDEPTAPLAREIGDLVVRAVETRQPGGDLPTTPTGRLNPDPAAWGEATPLMPALEESTRPFTPSPDPADHAVRTKEGEVREGLSFAEVVEQIATRKLGLEDEVRVGDGEFRRIFEIQQLNRLLPGAEGTPTTRQTPAARPADRAISIDGGAFISALAHSVVAKETGLWLCEQGGARKEVYLVDGSPELVTSNLAGELLGESLVAKGLISRGELDMALAMMPRFEGRLGDTLVELGLIQSVDLFRHMGSQLRERLLDIFLWQGGAASFYRGAKGPSSGFPLGLDPWKVLDEGIRRRFAEGLEGDLFGPRLMEPVVRSRRVPTEVATASLLPFVAEALRRTKEPMPLHELVEALEDPNGHDPGRGYRAVLLLMHLEALDWAPSGP